MWVLYVAAYVCAVAVLVTTPAYLAGRPYAKQLEELRRADPKAGTALRKAGRIKITLVVVGGALALVIPGQLTKELALHEHAKLEAVARQAAMRAGLEYRGALSSEDLEGLTRRGPADVPSGQVEQVKRALTSAGYDVDSTDDPVVIEAAFGPDDSGELVEAGAAEPGDPSGFGIRGVLLGEKTGD